MADLVPALTSRVVTIKATDLTESYPGKGSVTFRLECDLLVAGASTIVQAGTWTVPLDAQGQGQVDTLPVFVPGQAITRQGEQTWWLSYSTSWHRPDCATRIQIPAGSSPISLAAIPPMQELRKSTQKWALTNVQMIVKEGSAWGATGSVNGGTLTITLTVPPAASGDGAIVMPGEDFDNFRTTGRYRVTSVAAALAVAHMPTDRTGVLEVFTIGGLMAQQVYWTMRSPEDEPTAYIRGVAKFDTGAWSPWRELAVVGSASAAAPVASSADERAVRVDRCKARVGGRIGTGGRPYITLRFDDWSDAMDSVVMPRLRARRLPAAWAATVRWVEDTTVTTTATWASVAAWHADGVELMGHSWTHSQATGTAAIRKELIESADYIESKVPGSVIDTWTFPGTGADAATYDNFGTGTVTANYYAHEAGRMLLGRYPVVMGASAGWHKPLTGEPHIGQSHSTYEAQTLAVTKALIDAAVASGAGITLMAHPGNLGQTGYMSLADFDALLDYIAELRRTGQAMVGSARGQAYADIATSWRQSLLAASAGGLAGWSNTTGWSAGSGALYTATGGVLTCAIDYLANRWCAGGQYELAVKVKTPAGAVIRLGIAGAVTKSADITVAASPDWQVISLPVSIPSTISWNATGTASVGRVSGGAVTIDTAVYAAI